ncbi:MAG: hypothetical protein ACTSV8_05135 [Candidatus Thorarchaeota archaeon]
MPSAVFILHLDDMQGFIVVKRYPTTFSLNEKILNLAYYNHVQGEKSDLKIHEIEGMRIATYGDATHPGWLVCMVLAEDEDYGPYTDEFAGMGHLMLELAVEDPDLVDVRGILVNRSVIPTPTVEQKCASIFLTPSSVLLLERLRERGAERSAALAIWLREQIQAEDVDIIAAVRPLMESGVVHVEMVQKTAEVVFLLADVFAYRAPPVEAIKYAEEHMPDVAEEYHTLVKEFFSPDPPARGYNPTLPTEDPNAPIVEDCERMASLISKSLTYTVLQHLRKRPMTLEQVSEESALPKSVVRNALWALEAERVVSTIRDDVWVLITNPVIETFLPEYVLDIVKKRVAEKEIGAETARRYLELLVEKWSEPR